MEAARQMEHLVIGGTGFVGGHLVEHLIARGGTVRVLARRAERPAWLPARAELVQGDLAEPASLIEPTRGADYVYLTAPLPAPTPDEATATARLEQSLRGLVAICRQAHVRRLVALGGVEVYPARLPARPIDEDYPVAPGTVAGRLRLATETTLRTAAAAERLPLTLLRAVTIFGPRDHGFTRAQLDRYAGGDGPGLVGGGRARLSLVYVKDVARALALAARHPHAAGQTFHVSGCATTWRAFVATMCAELDMPSPPPGLPYWLASLLGWWAERTLPADEAAARGRAAVDQVGRTRVYSDARLTRLLGYHPAYDLLAAMHETTAWYRGNARQRPRAAANQAAMAV